MSRIVHRPLGERRSPRRLALAALLLALTAGSAAATDKATLAAELLRLTGIEGQLHLLGAGLERTAGAHGPRLPPTQRTMIARLLRETFSSRTLNEAALAYLTGQIDAERAHSAIGWLKTPEMQEVVRLEQQVMAPDFEHNKQTWALSMRGREPSSERVALIKRIEAAGQSTNTIANLAYVVGLAIANARNGAAGYPVPFEVVSEDLQRSISRSYRDLERETLISLHYTYRSLPDEALARLAAALESETGRWTSRVTTEALTAAAGTAARVLTARLQAEFEAAPGR